MYRCTVAELPARLAARGYGSAHYSIGVPRRNAVCIQQVGDAWVVCPKFEGHMTAVGRFDDEREACQYVFRLINDEEYRAGPDGAKANRVLQEYFARDRVPVEERIRAFGVGTAHYSIGEIRDSAWCLVKEDGRWLVFYLRNGKRTSRSDYRWDFAAAEAAFPLRIKRWRDQALARGVPAEALAADR
ncbi:hypothetical protein [Glycomyces sp. NPDC048151]|uniref:hypothetical protein n=1 Tax=Glycomyces sp. NPDC048151 TaxID=3364002 RepID=UPI003718FE6A